MSDIEKIKEDVQKQAQDVFDSNYLDLDVFMPAKRIVKISGVEIDVSFVPSKIALSVVKNFKQLNNIAKNPETIEPADMDILVGIASEIMLTKDPNFTTEYILNKMTLQQMIFLVMFVMKSVNTMLEKKN